MLARWMDNRGDVYACKSGAAEMLNTAFAINSSGCEMLFLMSKLFTAKLNMNRASSIIYDATCQRGEL